MKFYGRDSELKKIRNEISKDGLNTALIYGRRRVGKSELVKTAIIDADVPCIYYECKQVTEESNAEGMSDVASEMLSLPKLGYKKIEDLLSYLFEMSVSKKMIIVIDEYPYLRESVKGADSILQVLIDKYKEQAQLTLILLGSFVDVMKSMLEKENPLYGRIDLVISLKQMDYYESALFYPGFSEEDKVRIYSVFGGIPYYNRLIDDTKSVRDNIIDLIASDGARLENEVSQYLNAEISKMVNANEVFEALARGYSKFSDILSQSHVSSSPTLVDILNKLIKMEVVVKIAPINDEDNKKKAGYFICDNLSLFYYKYIFSHISQLRIMDREVFYDKYIQDDFESDYVPHRFEEVAKQYLIRKNKKGEIDPVIEKIGKYYYDDPVNKANGEFDVVTSDEKGLVFYEVKFRKKPLTSSMITEEIEQVKTTGLNCYKYVFITRAGVSADETDEIRYISLKEIYA